jgi:hypothetical protein
LGTAAIDMPYQGKQPAQALFMRGIDGLARGPEMDASPGDTEQARELVPGQSAAAAQLADGRPGDGRRMQRRDVATGPTTGLLGSGK